MGVFGMDMTAETPVLQIMLSMGLTGENATCSMEKRAHRHLNSGDRSLFKVGKVSLQFSKVTL